MHDRVRVQPELSRGGRLYTAFPSLPNPNDNGFPAHLMQRAGDFPTRAFLKGLVGKTRNQQQTGMCTGEGSTGVGMILYQRKTGKMIDFAPEFTYALERLREGTFDQGDVGAEVSTSLEVPDPAMDDVNCVGWCPVDVSGYTPLDIASKPSDAQMEAAKQYPGGAHHSLGNNIANIKSCILSDYPGAIGIAVYESFESDSTAGSGLIPLPNFDVEKQLGGHEMLSVLGFDDTIQCPNSPNPGAVLTQNSWGPEWGIVCPEPVLSSEGGFCWISYDYLMNVNLTSDIRMAHLGKPW